MSVWRKAETNAYFWRKENSSNYQRIACWPELCVCLVGGGGREGGAGQRSSAVNVSWRENKVLFETGTTK